MSGIFRNLSLLCPLLSIAAQSAEVDVHVIDSESQPVTNAVVVVTPADDQQLPPLTNGYSVVDQIDREFINKVSVIRTGTAVQFPNSDDIRHHVYSFSAPKPFELPLYSGTPAEAVIFDKPGVVKIGCNIHDWMIGYIYITDSPYFAITDSTGKAHIGGLHSGMYTAHVWQSQMLVDETATSRQLTLNQESFETIEWQLDIKPDLRPRRSPLPASGSYR